jgi:4-azaleucine resistance transporter AzlC
MRALIRQLDAGTVGDMALVCIADAIVGASFGAITVSSHLPLWLPVAMSLIVFAGSAQIAMVGILLAGGSPIAAAMTGLALNGRLLAYGFAVHDVFGKSRLARLLGAHFIVDESAAFAMQQLQPAKKRAAFWTAGLMMFVMWNVAVAAGAFMGRSLASASTLGLDATFPVILFALVWPSLARGKAGLHRRTAAGSLLALGATLVLAPGLAVLVSLLALVPVRWRSRNGGNVRDTHDTYDAHDAHDKHNAHDASSAPLSPDPQGASS